MVKSLLSVTGMLLLQGEGFDLYSPRNTSGRGYSKSLNRGDSSDDCDCYSGDCSDCVCSDCNEGSEE